MQGFSFTFPGGGKCSPLWGEGDWVYVGEVLFKKIEFEQKVRVFNGKNLIRKNKIYDNYFANFEKCEKL